MQITNCGQGVHAREVTGVDKLKSLLPVDWYAFTNLDVFTGDGEPDPEVRPQNDPSNPQPCSPEDKKKYPNGQLPQPTPTATAEIRPAPDAGTGDEDDLSALIKGGAGDGGAKADAGGPKGNESEDDLMNLIKGGGGAADAAAAPPPAPKGNETEDDLMNLIKGGKDGG